MTTDGTTMECPGSERLGVDLGERSYDILIGDGLLADAGRLIAPVLRSKQVAVITDRNVAGSGHLATLETALAAAGIASRTIVLDPGEQTKDFAHLEQVIGDLLAGGIDRKTTLIALGGGVIGDLTGVCAALTLRGIDFVQVPTTLLAQVDSSVGGKTAINTAQGKNLVGAFYQPRLVLADTGVLDTLPPRELRAGYAEVVKYGVIDMPDFFDWLEGNGPALLAGDAAARRHAILTCCDAKARIVSADETEQGQRALLNLGHTFGHALEAEGGYGGPLLHGEAVSVGMVMAFALSAELGLCPAEDAARVRNHLKTCGLPVDPPRPNGAPMDPRRLLAHMGSDKKVEAGHVTFVLARGIGRSYLDRTVAPDRVLAILEQATSA